MATLPLMFAAAFYLLYRYIAEETRFGKRGALETMIVIFCILCAVVAIQEAGLQDAADRFFRLLILIFITFTGAWATFFAVFKYAADGDRKKKDKGWRDSAFIAVIYTVISTILSLSENEGLFLTGLIMAGAIHVIGVILFLFYNCSN